MNCKKMTALRAVAAGLVTMLAVMPAVAQYEEPREYTIGEARFVAVGVVHRDFQPRSGNSSPDSAAIRYKAYMPVVSFHQGPFDVGIGYTRYTLAGSTRSSVYVGAVLTNEVPVAVGRLHALAVPLCLAMDFTKAEGTGPERDNFNVASLGIGTGLRYRYRGDGVEGTARLLGAVHYSFEGLSTGSGSSVGLFGDATLILRSIHIGEGLALGYRVRYQQWSMSDTRFDYRVFHHGPYLGILF
ncbi:MAG: hypothetical protein H6Q31_2841 [Bacteroidetes bacterium]|nr:hypothetical protein [Bacteroidota bacterium]